MAEVIPEEKPLVSSPETEAVILFRFASIADPVEALPNGDTTYNVLQHPNFSGSVFGNVVSGVISTDEIDAALTEAVQRFDPLHSAYEVIKINRELYDFSKVIITYTVNTSDAALYNQSLGVPILSGSTENILWDNLYYQTITKRSSQIANTIIQMLRGNAFLKEYRNQSESRVELSTDERSRNRNILQRIASAAAVIPDKLIIAKKKTDAATSSGLDNSSKESLLRRNAADRARFEIDILNKVLGEINSLNTNSVEKKLKISGKDSDNSGKLDIGEKAGSKSDKLNIGDKGDSESIDSFSEEFLNEYLSPDAKKYFDAVKQTGNQSIARVIAALKQRLDLQYHQLSKNTESNKGKIFYRGLVIPVNRNPVNNSYVIFSERKFGSNLYNVFITQYFESQGTALVSIEMEAENPVTGEKIHSHANQPLNKAGNYVTYLLFDGGIALNESGYNLRGRYEIENPIHSRNLYMPGFQFGKTFYGFMHFGTSVATGSSKKDSRHENAETSQLAFRETGPDAQNQRQANGGEIAFKEIEDSDPESPGNDKVALYGVKKVGILEYKRVEQRVCCYVAGEVSHIENIMAREYKEKASRTLTRTEIIQEDISEKEAENLSDTTSTDRYEMNKEMSQVIQEEQSRQIGINAGLTYKPPVPGDMQLFANTSLNFSNSSATTNSFSQSESFAKEIVQRVMQRVVTKMTSKRTSRMLREYEDTNKHGFDNRKGNKHVTGIYRWVDIIYQNVLVNYGKRLQYDFMVPEPAKNFKEWMTRPAEDGGAGNLIKAPKPLSAFLIDDPDNDDPQSEIIRDEDGNVLSGWKSVTEFNFANAAAEYGADVDAPPDSQKEISKSFAENPGSTSGQSRVTGGYGFEFKIPDGYKCKKFKFYYSHVRHGEGNDSIHADVRVAIWKNDGNSGASTTSSSFATNSFVTIRGTAPGYPYWLNMDSSLEDNLGIAVTTFDVGSFSLNVIALCERKSEFYEAWQRATYLSILKAYNKRLEEYNNAQAATPQESTKPDYNYNPGIGRAIEQRELQRLCMEMMLAPFGIPEVPAGSISTLDDLNAFVENYVTGHYYKSDCTNVYKVKRSEILERRALYIKFMEEAFSWDLMSYYFYPYYTGPEAQWEKLINETAGADPLFQAFLQSGMGRVTVPVRPGFEYAVIHLLNTGEIWKAATIPEGDLYLSIAELLRVDEGKPESVWKTRVPSSLTIIQTDSNPLQENGLPCFDVYVYDEDGNIKTDLETGQPILKQCEDGNPLAEVGEDGPNLIGGQNPPEDNTGTEE